VTLKDFWEVVIGKVKVEIDQFYSCQYWWGVTAIGR